MNIKTSFDYPPIPCREMDWSAVDSDTYDYDQPVGHGATEEAAIEDLRQQLDMNEPDDEALAALKGEKV